MRALFFVVLVALSPLSARSSPETTSPSDSDSINEGENIEPGSFPGPFLTGPLLTPSANTIPKGHFNIESYVFFNNNVAYYNNHWHVQKFGNPPHNINIPISIQFGLAKRVDFTIVPQFFFNYENPYKDHWRFGDLTAGMAFQLLFEDNTKGIPALKFSFTQWFPTGQYDHLDLAELGTDASGGGSFVSQFALVTSYLWHITGAHYLAFRWQVSYLFYTQARVHGTNAYGGDPSTKGWVNPGNNARTFVGFEFTVTKHWALALDIAAHYTLPTRFKGTTILPVGNNHHSYQLSLAPAIEYNKDEHLGIIGGIWFTLQGKSAFDFFNGVLAVNWYI